MEWILKKIQIKGSDSSTTTTTTKIYGFELIYIAAITVWNINGTESRLGVNNYIVGQNTLTSLTGSACKQNIILYCFSLLIYM